MKKWLTLVLALAICLVPMSAFAIDYPVDSDVTLIMWKQLDGSIAEGGYTTSNETPGFMKWVEDTGIKVEIQEYADSTSLVLALNGASTLPDMYTVCADFLRQHYVIIDQERYAVLPAERKDLLCLPLEGLTLQLLFPKLYHRDPATQGRLHLLHQCLPAQPAGIGDRI